MLLPKHFSSPISSFRTNLTKEHPHSSLAIVQTTHQSTYSYHWNYPCLWSLYWIIWWRKWNNLKGKLVAVSFGFYFDLKQVNFPTSFLPGLYWASNMARMVMNSTKIDLMLVVIKIGISDILCTAQKCQNSHYCVSFLYWHLHLDSTSPRLMSLKLIYNLWRIFKETCLLNQTFWSNNMMNFYNFWNRFMVWPIQVSNGAKSSAIIKDMT